MTGILPEKLSFTHNGQTILAVLVENAPGAGDWTIIETCTICNQPLAHHSFYATAPLLFYIHAHCIYDCAATAAPPIDAANSGTQSRWMKLTATSVVGSFMEAMFSLLLSGS